MKRIRSILRGREGMTLVELVVGAGLLCLVIGIFSASLRPAAEVSRRTQELNSAELIADDLLENRAQQGGDRHGLHQMLRQRHGCDE